MATTWTSGVNSSKAVCTTNNESSSVLDDATSGLSLDDCVGLVVTVEADNTRTLSGSGSLTCYLYDPAAAAWVPAPTTLNLTVNASGVRRQSFVVPNTSLVRRGRIAYLPTSVGVSAGGVTVYIGGGR